MSGSIFPHNQHRYPTCLPLLIAVLWITLVLLAACGPGAPQPAAQPTAEGSAQATATTRPAAAVTAPTEAAPTAVASATAVAAPDATDAPAAVAPPTVVPPTTVPPTAVPAEPFALSTGAFNEIDRLHYGAGNASIYQLPDASRVLRLEADFFVSEGPDLYVWLTGHPSPVTDADATGAGYVNLGILQAREGYQEYVIPGDTDLSAYRSAIIWCEEFRQVMTSATLQEAPAP